MRCGIDSTRGTRYGMLRVGKAWNWARRTSQWHMVLVLASKWMKFYALGILKSESQRRSYVLSLQQRRAPGIELDGPRSLECNWCTRRTWNWALRTREPWIENETPQELGIEFDQPESFWNWAQRTPQHLGRSLWWLLRTVSGVMTLSLKMYFKAAASSR